MSYTLAEAAQATGLNRSTIWRVEPVELHRVFPEAQATPEAVPQHAYPDIELRLRLAQAELKGRRRTP
jgi:hypothetical protein